jgi:hypothetical protein
MIAIDELLKEECCHALDFVAPTALEVSAIAGFFLTQGKDFLW